MLAESKQLRYRAAIIGIGRAQPSNIKGGGDAIGYTHAAMFQRQPRTALIAAADIDADNLQAFQLQFDLSHGFRDYHTMLRDMHPDVVSICTYVGLHHSMIKAAAYAGAKGIICEKPFLVSPAELAAVRQIAAETGVKVVVAHTRRYLPVFERARELYNAGAVSEPILCFSGLQGWDLSEMGSHWIDLFRFFHADRPIRWVVGQARVRDTRGYGHAMEDHAVAYFEFDGGGRAMLDGGQAFNGQPDKILVGTHGIIRLDDQTHTLTFETAGHSREESFADHPRSSWEATWDGLLDDVLAWLDGARESRCGLTSGSLTCEVSLAAYLSALSGDRLDLPLDGNDPAWPDEWPVEVLARRWSRRQH